MGVAGPGAGLYLRALGQAGSRVPQVDLVWSGPEARDARRVFEGLLGSAERALLISTFAFFDGPKAFEVLVRRVEVTAALQATLLLNIQRRRGDTSASEPLLRRFAERFWGTERPGAARPRVYFDLRSLDPDGRPGCSHAKAVVGDDEVVFVTSANLTEAALDCRIEVGLLVRDRALALTVAGHFTGLIDRGLLCPLPPP